MCDAIEITEGMTLKEELAVLLRQYYIRQGQDHTVNDPPEYNRVKGIQDGLRLAIDQIEKRRDKDLQTEIEQYLKDEFTMLPRHHKLMAEEIMGIFDCHTK